MAKDVNDRITAARDLATSLLFELRMLAEEDGCDEEVMAEAVREIDKSLSLTKSAVLLAGHKTNLGSSEDNNPFTEDGLKKKVLCVELKRFYDTITEAHKDTGVNSGNILQVLRGSNKTAGGYHWMYVDPSLVKKGSKKSKA